MSALCPIRALKRLSSSFSLVSSERAAAHSHHRAPRAPRPSSHELGALGLAYTQKLHWFNSFLI